MFLIKWLTISFDRHIFISMHYLQQQLIFIHSFIFRETLSETEFSTPSILIKYHYHLSWLFSYIPIYNNVYLRSIEWKSTLTKGNQTSRISTQLLSWKTCPEIASIFILCVWLRYVRKTCTGRGEQTVDVWDRLKDWVRILQSYNMYHIYCVVRVFI